MQILGSGMQLNPNNIAQMDSQIAEKLLSDMKPADGTKVSLANMEPGTYFRGKVLEFLGNQVNIGTENGGSFLAKIEGNIPLEIGQSLFFEVKSNDKGKVAIRPAYAQNNVDVTAEKALKAANLSDTPKNKEIVRNLLEEKMPVDKQNIQKVMRYAVDNPGVPVKTLIQMMKADIPVTKENMVQFRNYQEQNHQLIQEMDKFLDDFMSEINNFTMDGQPKEVLEFHQKVLEFVLSAPKEGGSAEPQQLQQLQSLKDIFAKIEQVILEKPETADLTETTFSQTKDFVHQLIAEFGIKEQTVVTAGSESSVVLQPGEFQTGNIAESVPKVVEELMNRMETLLKNPETLTMEDFWKEIKGFLDKPEYEGLLKKTLVERYLLLPEEVTDKENVKELYRKMQQELQTLQELTGQLPKQDGTAGKQLQNIDNNLNFMNQLNQMYSYVQLPLKLAGENAHGDLYVFADKKRLRQDKEELSALLHLEMDHLGAMDVYVTLNRKKVGTKITLEKEASLDLFAAHIHELTESLQKKGYVVETSLEMGEAKPDFVDDFLLKGEKGGEVNRFSFDVKA